MKNHNKLIIASQFLLNAARDYKLAESDIDYAKCILQAGAVINICFSLVEEAGGISTQRASADLATRLMESQGTTFNPEERKNQIRKFIGVSTFVYNSLKHSGDKSRALTPSNDIFFDADLKSEAEESIRDAIEDFKKVPHSQWSLNQYDTALLDLLHSPWPD